jgi:hypothetical protein
MPLPKTNTLKSSPISEGLIRRWTALVALSLESVAVGSPEETSTASPQEMRKYACVVKPWTSEPPCSAARAIAVKSTCAVMSCRPGMKKGSPWKRWR